MSACTPSLRPWHHSQGGGSYSCTAGHKRGVQVRGAQGRRPTEGGTRSSRVRRGEGRQGATGGGMERAWTPAREPHKGAAQRGGTGAYRAAGTDNDVAEAGPVGLRRFIAPSTLPRFRMPGSKLSFRMPEFMVSAHGSKSQAKCSNITCPGSIARGALQERTCAKIFLRARASWLSTAPLPRECLLCGSCAASFTWNRTRKQRRGSHPKCGRERVRLDRRVTPDQRQPLCAAL